MIQAVVKKELRQIIRDTRTLGVLLFVPVFLLVMFGYAISLDVKNAPIAVVDHDKSRQSRELIRGFSHSEYFDLAYFTDDTGQLESMFLDETVQGALVIPGDFSKRILRGEDTTVQVLIDGTNGTTGSALLGYMQAVVIDYAGSLQEARLGVDTAQVLPIDYRPRVWFNPELESNQYLIPGLVAFILVVTAVISTALSVVREKELGTLEQIAASPLRPVDLILGKTLPYMVISAVIAASIFVASYFFFDVGVAGSLLWLAGVTLLFLFACLGLGIFISSIAETQQVAFLIAILSTFLPSFILSGFVFPIENMPVPIQAVTYLVPARYYLSALRAIMLKGAGVMVFWPDVLLLAIFAAATVGAGIFRLRTRSVLA
ncbi:MAG: ABC transporter permease [Spirochaetes bacterium]|jgi:ABC-2 type transport system permease protein|nr:ABC transporter permease [Spirochaetota bacterium]